MPIEYLSDAMKRIVTSQEDAEELGSGYGGANGPTEGPVWFKEDGYLLFSDIHGNLEALQAVLSDARSQGAEEVFCLGDIIGYGPNPVQCLDEVRRTCKLTILGNHDQAALFDPDGFNQVALAAVYWTRDQLENAPGNQQMVNRRWDWLGELPRMHSEQGILFVHGSPRNPVNEYVFPEDIYNARKLERIFALVEHYSFQGHTHVPGVFTDDGRFLTPDELGGRYSFGSGKAMVNVGSVGQPRDGDPRSSYVLLSDSGVEFRRVAYPVEKTMEKIYAVAELEPFLADRLKDGR